MSSFHRPSALRPRALFAATLLASLVGGCALDAAPPESTGQAEGAITSVSIASLPKRLRRIAAQFVIDAAADGSAPGWAGATLSTTAIAFESLAAPGMTGYYEITTSKGGCVVVSTGAHDTPIVLAREEGACPAALLKSQAALAGKTIARFVLMGPSSFAAEDASGALVAQVGDLPLKKSGYDLARLDTTAAIRKTVSRPVATSTAADGTEVVARVTTETGPTHPTAPKVAPYASWSELKADAKRPDGPGYDLEQLRRLGARRWAKIGAGGESTAKLVPGERYRIAALSTSAKVSLSGSGAAGVVAKAPTTGGEPYVDLTIPSGAIAGATLTVTLIHADGSRESLPLAIAAARACSPQWRQSVVGRGWSDQPNYEQFTIAGGCLVGCGPVAWGMMLAWGDVAAQGLGPFRGRWNLLPGSVAPLQMFSDLNADGRVVEEDRNGDGVPDEISRPVHGMISSLHEDLETSCFLNVGGRQSYTYPWNMDQVDDYLDRVGTRATARTWSSDWSVIGCPTCTDESLVGVAVDTIKFDHTPAIIGYGSHYALAYAVRERCVDGETETDYRLNQGWGKGHGDWIDAERTWWVGTLTP